MCRAGGGSPAGRAAILHALADFSGPIAIGLRSAHVDGANLTLPLGVRVRLDLSGQKIRK